MKTFNGKAIYNPSGKAGEYSLFACNFFKGCSGKCSYCYLKKGVLSHTLGGDKPELKSCFISIDHAKETFLKELKLNKPELEKHGLFFSFTSDFLPETSELLIWAIEMCLFSFIPVKILTKQVDWITNNWLDTLDGCEKEIAFGFTLTGHDVLEPGCASNAARIDKMKRLHFMGFKTWASIEPIIDFESSFQMISEVAHSCDLFKIGLSSGKKYDKNEINFFVSDVRTLLAPIMTKIYFKDSLLKSAGIDREILTFLKLNNHEPIPRSN
jgi:DNA repair photolyase